jgi:hypothetical protein
VTRGRQRYLKEKLLNHGAHTCPNLNVNFSNANRQYRFSNKPMKPKHIIHLLFPLLLIAPFLGHGQYEGIQTTFQAGKTWKLSKEHRLRAQQQVLITPDFWPSLGDSSGPGASFFQEEDLLPSGAFNPVNGAQGDDDDDDGGDDDDDDNPGGGSGNPDPGDNDDDDDDNDPDNPGGNPVTPDPAPDPAPTSPNPEQLPSNAFTANALRASTRVEWEYRLQKNTRLTAGYQWFLRPNRDVHRLNVQIRQDFKIIPGKLQASARLNGIMDNRQRTNGEWRQFWYLRPQADLSMPGLVSPFVRTLVNYRVRKEGSSFESFGLQAGINWRLGEESPLRIQAAWNFNRSLRENDPEGGTGIRLTFAYTLE